MAPVTNRRRIAGGRLATCVDTTVIDDGTVVIDDDRIVWVGPSAECPAEHTTPEREVVDVGGATIMPGLVDAHMHISFGEPRTEEELFIYTPGPYRAIRAAVSAETVLMAGVTGACDPGGATGVAAAVRDAIDAGLIQGPRMSAAGRQITTQQGIGDTLPRWIDIDDSSIGAIVRSRDDLLQEIRDQVKDGVDMIKLAASGPGTAEYGSFRADEVALAVDEAHRLDRPIASHSRSRQAVADAAAAGMDWIMHASYMDAPTLEVVLEHDIPLVPAMTLLVNTLEAAVPDFGGRDPIRRELDAAVSILSKAHADGATLVAGSESGFAMTPFGEWHTREIELFVSHLGMSDAEALLCMTRNAARAVPRDGADIGTLEPGKYADVLIVDGEPDRDVTILADRSKLRTIVKGGRDVAPWRPPEATVRMPFERARRYTDGLYTRAVAAAGPGGTVGRDVSGAARQL